jgi:hypothetical protein
MAPLFLRDHGIPVLLAGEAHFYLIFAGEQHLQGKGVKISGYVACPGKKYFLRKRFYFSEKNLYLQSFLRKS